MSAMRRVAVLSDFNVATFARLLEHDESPPPLAVSLAPYGDVGPVLVESGHPALAGCDAALVWTQPAGVIPSFRAVLAQGAVDPAHVLAEVDEHARRLIALAARVPRVFVPTWVVPTWVRGLGAADLAPGGVARTLLEMNRRLLAALDTCTAVRTLDAQRWTAAVGASAHDPRAWYLGKIPFSVALFQEAVRDLKAALAADAGATRKLIVLDLDDTLWGGLVGEVGWESLTLGAPDPIGEAYVDFQHALRALRARGILLAIASKNDEAVALEAMRRHPEMVLRPADFVAWRIDWEDKAANVAAIARELNLGLDAVVFIDDSPAERARVREALPEVLVPEWPAQRFLRVAALQGLRCFDTVGLTSEDRARSASYAADQQRAAARADIGSLEQWHQALDLRVDVRPVGRADAKRVVQLLNKTNQMNLRTRRTTEAELAAWRSGAGRGLWGFRVRDRFGDLGLVGVLGVEQAGVDVQIVDFVLSCRAFGREIERVMVATAVEHARITGAEQVLAEYLPTPRNAPVLEFFRRSGFREYAATFTWPAAAPYAVPAFVTLQTMRDEDGPPER